MKRLFLTAGICFHLLTANPAEAGWSGSGGDAYTGLFRAACIQTVQSVRSMPREQVPGLNYDINWNVAETTCATMEIELALQRGSNPEKPVWIDLRDNEGKSRTALFQKYETPIDIRHGKVILHGPRFAEELQTIPAGALLNILHENLKVMGLDDDNNAQSAQVFNDYNQQFMDLAVRYNTRLQTVYEATTGRMQIYGQIEENDQALAKAHQSPTRMTLADVKERRAIADELNGYLSSLILELATETDELMKSSKALAADYDVKAEAYWVKYDQQAKAMRAQMTEVAETTRKQMKKMNTMGFGFTPSVHANTIGAAMKISAAMIGLRPLLPRTTEMEWIAKDLSIREERIRFNEELLKHYRTKQQAVADRFVDVELVRF